MSAWSNWLRDHRRALVASPLPAFTYRSERAWTHLVEHGFLRFDGESFDVSDVSPPSSAALLAVLDSAPSSDTVLARELLFNTSKSNTLALEVLLRFSEREDEPTEDDVRQAALKLAPRVEQAYERLVVDRRARLNVTAEPPGIILTFWSDTISPRTALEVASEIHAQLASTRTVELVPLSWPPQFDAEMAEGKP